jgi:F-box and leucine-rich repeat protein GRR1
VQAFLREDLLAFCREAPPEFNEHQRDVFCVFSGNGVGRLREFLNHQKARAAAAAAAVAVSADGTEASLAGSSDFGDAAGGEEAHFSGLIPIGSTTGTVGGVDGDATVTATPVLNVAGNFSPGATPAVPTPSGSAVSGLTFAQVLQNGPWQQQVHQQGISSATAAGGSSSGSSNLSQSAPATTGSLWGAGGGIGTGLGLMNPASTASASGAGAWGSAGSGTAGAQHVTGMMGAAILDEVDEGDEAFGEGSEIMGD